MKKTILLFIFIYSGAFTQAQQEAQVSHNMYNHLDVNPGYAGLSGSNCATLIARQQWVGFRDPKGNKGFPQTYLLSVDRPINFLGVNGVGLTIMNDKLGFEKNINVEFSFSHHISIYKGKLGIGAQIGLFNKKIDFTKFIAVDPDDPSLKDGNLEGNTVLDFSAGAFYYSSKNIYFGLSLTQLRKAEYHLPDVLAKPTHSKHLYVEAGKYLQLSRSLEFAPSIFIKTDFASTQFDLNSILKFNNQFWAGLSWRTTDAIAVLIGITIPGGLEIGYSYDLTTSAIGANGRSSGSHEIMLHYCLKSLSIPQYGSHQTVRFLSPSINKK